MGFQMSLKNSLCDPASSWAVEIAGSYETSILSKISIYSYLQGNYNQIVDGYIEVLKPKKQPIYREKQKLHDVWKKKRLKKALYKNDTSPISSSSWKSFAQNPTSS